MIIRIISLSNNNNYIYYVTSLYDCKVLKIPKQSFEE